MKNIGLFFIALMLLNMSCKERASESLIKSNDGRIITNTNGPDIIEIKLKISQAVKAGSTFQILFNAKAKDAYSGSRIDLDSEIYASFVSKQGGRDFFVSGDSSFKRTDKKDWYIAELSAGEFHPSGNYTLTDFRVSDKVGNKATFKFSMNGKHNDENHKNTKNPLIIKVENDVGSDITPPIALSAKMKNPTVKPGGTATFLCNPTDEFYGIELQSDHGTGAEFQIEGGGKRINTYRGKLKALEENWYSIEFNIKKDQPLGVYYLQHFKLNDKAGNRQRISITRDRGYKVDYNFLVEFIVQE